MKENIKRNLFLTQFGFTFELPRSARTGSAGFTLIEILVTVAVIGILMTTISAIFINTLRNANQASIINEARQNSSTVLDAMERDIRNANDARPFSGTDTSTQDIVLTYDSGSSVYWKCTPEVPGSFVNGSIQRGDSLPTLKAVTNLNARDGISVYSCNFTIAGTKQRLVTFNFSLTEGANAHTASQDFTVNLPYTLSIGTRTF